MNSSLLNATRKSENGSLEEALRLERIEESYLSLFGVGLGGGLFLIIIVVGVIFWTTRERER